VDGQQQPHRRAPRAPARRGRLRPHRVRRSSPAPPWLPRRCRCARVRTCVYQCGATREWRGNAHTRTHCDAGYSNGKRGRHHASPGTPAASATRASSSHPLRGLSAAAHADVTEGAAGHPAPPCRPRDDRRQAGCVPHQLISRRQVPHCRFLRRRRRGTPHEHLLMSAQDSCDACTRRLASHAAHLKQRPRHIVVRGGLQVV
jgi:hypothetical protein